MAEYIISWQVAGFNLGRMEGIKKWGVSLNVGRRWCMPLILTRKF
jgi:hypothetical protein